MGIYDWGMNRAKGTVGPEKNTDPNNTHTNRNREARGKTACGSGKFVPDTTFQFVEELNS